MSLMYSLLLVVTVCRGGRGNGWRVGMEVGEKWVFNGLNMQILFGYHALSVMFFPFNRFIYFLASVRFYYCNRYKIKKYNTKNTIQWIFRRT